jgi:hypothetical protein
MKSIHTPERNNQSNSAQGGFQILLGIVFLLAMSGVSIFGRSIWLVMGLLPVYWIVVSAYRLYREDGYLSNRVLAMMICSLFPFVFIAAAIVGINMGRIWPIALIAVGATTILSSRR